jgi:hypothetical protein
MMQFSGSHRGTFTAMPRFSYFVVPVGKKPRGSKAETGRSSPFCSMIGYSVLTKNSSASAGALANGAPSVVVAQDSGYLISCTP